MKQNRWAGTKSSSHTKNKQKKIKPPNPKGMDVMCWLAQARRARLGCPGGDVPFLPPAPLTEEKNKKNRKKA